MNTEQKRTDPLVKQIVLFRTTLTALMPAIMLMSATSCQKSNPAGDASYTLTTSAVNGTILKSPDKTAYQSGETVALTAVADSGYVFLRWSGDANGTNAAFTLTMDANKSATANFIPGTLLDADGNVYHIAKIGSQVWTKENLRTTKFNDGASMPFIIDSASWAFCATPGYCYYHNATDQELIKKFGALYNWHAVNSKKLAPPGWHVPTDADWDTLLNYLIAHEYNWDGTTDSNKVAKSVAATTDWIFSTIPGATGNDLTTNDKTGFSALPSGFRNLSGSFLLKGSGGYWWSATEYNGITAFYRSLVFNDYGLIRYDGDKSCGFSVRLIRD